MVQLSSLIELCSSSTFCYFGFYRFANFALAKTGVPQPVLTQGLWNTSGCLEPLRSPPSSQSWLSASFCVDPIFWNPKASSASFTKQGGKWKSRVSPSQGKGLYSASHPILRWCHPMLGLEGLAGNMHLSTIPHAWCYNFVSLTTAGSKGGEKSLRCWAVAFVHHFFPEPILLAICRVHPERVLRWAQNNCSFSAGYTKENYSPGVS